MYYIFIYIYIYVLSFLKELVLAFSFQLSGVATRKLIRRFLNGEQADVTLKTP
jgi:hypothetical protein